MRPSEQYALEWKQVDFHRKLLLIRQGFVKGRVTMLKTAGSRRDVDMLPHVEEALRSHRDATQGAGQYVFSNTEGGALHRDNMRNRIWNPELAQAGLRHRNPYQTAIRLPRSCWIRTKIPPGWRACWNTRRYGCCTSGMASLSAIGRGSTARSR
jgi:integrase